MFSKNFALHALVWIVLLAGFGIFIYRSVTTSPLPMTTTASAQTLSPDVLTQNLRSANLPVAQIVERTVPDAKGTVIYIPQNHLVPGTDPLSSQNDSAIQTQDQISKIVQYVTSAADLGYVMVEGSLYGPVTSSSLDVQAKELNSAAALSKAADAYSPQCQDALCQRAIIGAHALGSSLQRDGMLKGGANSVKALGGSFALIGAEDKTTETQAGDLVRNYYYLNDRLASLQPQQQQQMGPSLASLANVLPPASAPVTDVSSADLAALGGAGSDAFKQAVNDAHAAKTAAQALQLQLEAGLPSRTDNPYASETDASLVQSQITKAQQDIQSVIVDGRNVEAATNFAKGLSDQSAHSGVLVFGAGHTSGLMRSLQDQKLNVIVVVPQQLGNDSELSSALAS